MELLSTLPAVPFDPLSLGSPWSRSTETVSSMHVCQSSINSPFIASLFTPNCMDKLSQLTIHVYQTCSTQRAAPVLLKPLQHPLTLRPRTELMVARQLDCLSSCWSLPQTNHTLEWLLSRFGADVAQVEAILASPFCGPCVECVARCQEQIWRAVVQQAQQVWRDKQQKQQQQCGCQLDSIRPEP